MLDIQSLETSLVQRLKRYIPPSLSGTRLLHPKIKDSCSGVDFPTVLCARELSKSHHFPFFSRSEGGLFLQGAGAKSSPHVSSPRAISLSCWVSPRNIIDSQETCHPL